MAPYNYDKFLTDKAYENETWSQRNTPTATSIQYNRSDWATKAKGYYGDKWDDSWGQDIRNLETSDLYKGFTEHVKSGIQNKDENTWRYLYWLYNKTSNLNSDGSRTEGGNANRQIGSFLLKYWDPTLNNNSGGFKNTNFDQNDLDELAERYTLRRNDQKFGYYHLGPAGTTTPTVPTVQENNIQQNEDLTSIPNYSPIKPNKSDSSNYPGWSDWIPLTMRKINDDVTAKTIGRLERLKRFQLKEAPYRQEIVTNAYATRQMLEQQKAQLLSRSAAMDGSDINQNLRNRLSVEDQIAELNSKQADWQQNDYNQTRQKHQETLNWNKEKSVEVANYNRQQNVAAWNSILASRAAEREKLNSNLNTYIGDMYSNYGEYLKTKRLNENAQKRAAATKTYADEYEKAFDSYTKLQNDPSRWSEFDSFISTLGGLDVLTDQQIQLYNKYASREIDASNPAFKQMIISILNNSNNPDVQMWKSKYQAELKKVKEEAERAAKIAEGNYASTVGSINVYETNQWGPNISLLGKNRRSVLSHKSGGKLQSLIDFVKVYQKEEESIRKNTNKRHDRDSKNLNKQLDRISQEELILLRSAFK